jgi:MerR family transcriptional regulator, thiopeptide resistance regulator
VITQSWSVGELAALTGVTVRTLHHYDRIGLLPPGERTAAGYRSYTEADLLRLQRILAYRELGFSLEDIAALLDDPDSDPLELLRRQHGLVLERMERLAEVAAVLEKTMKEYSMGIRLNPEEMFEVFGDDDPAQYADEVEQRWGETDAYRESQRRSAQYTKDDWIRIKDEQEASAAALAEALRAGHTPDSDTAMDAAEQARLVIDRNFYPLSHEMHVCLGDMYVADPRFTKTYEDIAPGLAEYVRAAITANAARHGVRP